MKKHLLFIAAVALLLGLASCEKENNTPNTSKVKSVADLIDTQWTYVYSDTIVFDPNCDAYILNMEFGLYFDSNYAHISFPENVIAMNCIDNNGSFTMDEVEEMNFIYTYTASTHTGALTVNDVDDNGNPTTFQIPFTYDEDDDAIHMVLHIADDGDEDNAIPFTLTFHRNVN